MAANFCENCTHATEADNDADRHCKHDGVIAKFVGLTETPPDSFYELCSVHRNGVAECTDYEVAV